MPEIDTEKLRETFCKNEFAFVEENKNIGLLCDEIDRLRAGLNSIVNCQSHVARSYIREAAAEVLSGKTMSMADQSPFVVRNGQLRNLLRRAGEALAPACSGGDWGRVLAWVVNGASSNDAGIAAAKKIVAMQKGADTVAREIEEALDAS